MCSQWQVNSCEGDVSGMLRRNVPGHCYHTYGDA